MCSTVAHRPPPPSPYREGLTCDGLLVPVAPDTMDDLGFPLEEAVEMMPQVGERGLSYLGTVVDFHLTVRGPLPR